MRISPRLLQVFSSNYVTDARRPNQLQNTQKGQSGSGIGLIVWLLFLALGLGSIPAHAIEAKIEAAQEFFGQYQAYQRNFDSQILDMYAEDALIQNTRRYPTGNVRVLEIPVWLYKWLIRAVLPFAKLRKDLNSYSEITYTPEDGLVRIKASRFSHLKKYSSPIELLIGPDQNGQWLIYEEISESRP